MPGNVLDFHTVICSSRNAGADHTSEQNNHGYVSCVAARIIAPRLPPKGLMQSRHITHINFLITIIAPDEVSKLVSQNLAKCRVLCPLFPENGTSSFKHLTILWSSLVRLPFHTPKCHIPVRVDRVDLLSVFPFHAHNITLPNACEFGEGETRRDRSAPGHTATVRQYRRWQYKGHRRRAF